MNDRDIQLLEHMVRYCREIMGTVSYFGQDKQTFLENYIYFNSCSTPILQIGELAKRVSEDIIKAHPEIPWRQIKGARDYFVHDYLSIDKEMAWDMIENDIPSLYEKLSAILRER